MKIKPGLQMQITNQPKTCTQCGREFNPIWLGGMKKWSRTCATCALKNISEWLDELSPEDEAIKSTRSREFIARIRERIKSSK